MMYILCLCVGSREKQNQRDKNERNAKKKKKEDEQMSLAEFRRTGRRQRSLPVRPEVQFLYISHAVSAMHW